MNINIRAQDKLILESLYKNDGALSTTDLKASTGLDTDAIGYSVRQKLEPAGLLEYEIEDHHGAKTRVHQLTNKGRDEIKSGLIGDVFGDGSTTEDDPERVALEARINDLEDEVERLKNKTQANKQLLDSLRSRVDSLADYVAKHHDRLNGLRWAIEETVDVDVGEYVKRVRNDS